MTKQLRWLLVFGCGVGLLASAVTARPAMAATQATYYVATNGSNQNDGSESHPFQTIAHARDIVRGINGDMTGDIIINVHGGTYPQDTTLAFTQQDAGTNGYNVIYRAVDGETPIISGGQQITGWSVADSGKNIWQATVGTSLQTRQLYVNGVRAIRATGFAPATLTRTGDGTGYTMSNTTMDSWGNPSAIEFVYTGKAGTPNAPWTESRCDVGAISGTTITMVQPCFNNASQKQGNQGVTVPTSIENAYELLDQPGEWYLNHTTGVIYYLPRTGESLDSATVIAPTLETLMSGAGTLSAPLQNVQFLGFTFAYATWLRPSGPEGFVEEQANFTATSSTGLSPTPYNAFARTPANVSFSAAKNIRFERNTFTHLGGVGLEFEDGSQNNTIIGNVFTDISATGIQLGDVTTPNPSDTRAIVSDNLVSNNYLHDMPVEYRGGVAIFQGYVRGDIITHNEMNHLPYSGISTGWGWGESSTAPFITQSNQITNNLVANHMQVLSDGGGIYTNGFQGTSLSGGLLIDGNVVHDQVDEFNSLYTDDGSQYITLTHNVTYNSNNPFDWAGCNPIGDMDFEDNFYEKPINVGWCTQPPRVTVQNNTQIAGGCGGNATCQGIVANAGLQAAYQDIKGAASAIPMAGLVTWLKSDAGITRNGSTVSRWDDQSGRGFAFDQGTAGNQPTFVSDGLNGKPVVRFNGTSAYLQNPSAAANAPQYSVFVVSTLGSASPGPLYIGNTGGNGFGFYRQSAGNYGVLYGGVNVLSYGATTGDGFQLQEATAKDGITPASAYFVNGAQVGATAATAPNPPNGAMTIGGIDSGELWSGDIAEVLIYDRFLSASDRQQVEQYLNGRYFPSSASFTTSFESGQSSPTWTDTIDDTAPGGDLANVTGICCNLTQPEAGVRSEIAHTGSNALLYSGAGTSATSSYAYDKVFDLSGQAVTIGSGTTLDYWIYPQSNTGNGNVVGNNSTCVAVDIVFTDGTTLRDSGAVDQNGARLHPATQCGHLTLDTWNHVTSIIGSNVAGKTVARIDVGYDNEQADSAGGYRGYIDDIAISH